MKIDVVQDQSARYYTSTKPMHRTPLHMELGITNSSLMDIEIRAEGELNPGFTLDYHLIIGCQNDFIHLLQCALFSKERVTIDGVSYRDDRVPIKGRNRLVILVFGRKRNAIYPIKRNQGWNGEFRHVLTDMSQKSPLRPNIPCKKLAKPIILE